MPKRTTTIKLKNGFSTNLVVTSKGLDAGQWADPEPTGSLAPNGTMFVTSESADGYPKGFVNFGIEKHTTEWVLVWWEDRGAQAVGKNGAPRGTQRPKLFAEPQEWTRANEDEAFEVVVLARPQGGRNVIEACVAPFNQNCVTVPIITSMHRVLRGSEDRVIQKFAPAGADVNAWVVAGQPLRVKAIVPKPGDVTWSVRFTADGKTDDAPATSWHSKQDQLKIAKVPTGVESIRVEAKVGREVRGCVVRVALCGVSQYIALVKKLEVKSGNPPDWILNCLRGIAGYDSSFHDSMMGSTAAPSPAPYLPDWDVGALKAASAHASGGQTTDFFGNDLAVGHVITGLNAGLHRDKAFSPFRVGTPFDNLWGETIAGDLGQAAILKQLGKRPNLIGPLSGAEYSELRADLDGLALGDDADAHLKAAGNTVSGVLEKYYIVAPNDPAPLSAARRFGQSPLTAAQLKDPVTAFGASYSRYAGAIGGADDKAIQSAIDAFIDWDQAESANENAARAIADDGDLRDKNEGYDP